MVPDLSPEIVSAIWSPETGIVDSHSLMESFEKIVTDSECGNLAYAAEVVRVDPYKPDNRKKGQDGWVVQLVTRPGDGAKPEPDAVHAKTLINASGLSGTQILNSLLPPGRRIPMYFARGSYASYRGPGVKSVKHLLYPLPDTRGAKPHQFAGLGTHLTLDLQGNIRFGPDVEWLEPPNEGSGLDDANRDFWKSSLTPTSDRLTTMHEAITTYLPNITLEGLAPDYVGIRPKLSYGAFHDFEVRVDHSRTFLQGVSIGEGTHGKMISLLGIESPGLTSCLGLAEMVVEEISKGSVA
jgi:2-hydroxyglutarate dehydrogenase